jgi:pimeloyl-ACP methyl ester carboxylesterase
MLACTRDGADIYYEVYDFTDPWKPADTILLHHGARGNRNNWYAWIPALSRKYRTVVMDARGRGGSSVPEPGFNWSMEQYASDAMAVADALDVETLHFLGTSFGSAVGEQVAATYPERIKTLILTSPPYRFNHLPDVLDGWLRAYDELGADEFLRRDVRNMFPPGTDDALMDWHANQMAQVPLHVAKEIVAFLATVNMEDVLPRIQAPTLILAAIKSDRAPATEAEFMVTQIPDCEMVAFDSHHNITVTMPDECVARVLSFLERRGN